MKRKPRAAAAAAASEEERVDGRMDDNNDNKSVTVCMINAHTKQHHYGRVSTCNLVCVCLSNYALSLLLSGESVHDLSALCLLHSHPLRAGAL